MLFTSLLCSIDALIVRLEKQDQVSKAYAAERARGVFLTLLQRKRYLHALWQKKNEEEMLKLGISTKSPLQLDTSAAGLSPKSPRMANQWKNRSPGKYLDYAKRILLSLMAV